MSYSDTEIWGLILVIAIGTYGLRFSFLGLIGDRALSPFVLRLLRYTPVAVLPGLVAPLVLTGPDGGWDADPLRLAAAAATVAVGWRTRNLLAAIAVGAALFFGGTYLSSL